MGAKGKSSQRIWWGTCPPFPRWFRMFTGLLSSVPPTPTSHTSPPLRPPGGGGLGEQRQHARDAHCKVQSQESHPVGLGPPARLRASPLLPHSLESLMGHPQRQRGVRNAHPNFALPSTPSSLLRGSECPPTGTHPSATAIPTVTPRTTTARPEEATLPPPGLSARFLPDPPEKRGSPSPAGHPQDAKGSFLKQKAKVPVPRP